MEIGRMILHREDGWDVEEERCDGGSVGIIADASY
jgi:hypothetical protein